MWGRRSYGRAHGEKHCPLLVRQADKKAVPPMGHTHIFQAKDTGTIANAAGICGPASRISVQPFPVPDLLFEPLPAAEYSMRDPQHRRQKLLNRLLRKSPGRMEYLHGDAEPVRRGADDHKQDPANDFYGAARSKDRLEQNEAAMGNQGKNHLSAERLNQTSDAASRCADTHEAIVSDALFMAVQGKTAQKHAAVFLND